MADSPAYTVYTDDYAPKTGEHVSCTVIGTIETPYKRMEDCPTATTAKNFCPVRSASARNSPLVWRASKWAEKRWCCSGFTGPGGT
jgi:hypothetical protein